MKAEFFYQHEQKYHYASHNCSYISVLLYVMTTVILVFYSM